MDSHKLRLINKNLLEIADSIKLSEEESVKNRKQVDDFVKELVEWAKANDKLFALMYSEIAYLGSYYDDLKIENADEFDLNVVFSLPRGIINRCQLENSNNHPSFVKYRYEFNAKEINLRTYHYDVDDSTNNRFKNLFDEDNYLIPEKFIRLMQSILDRAYDYATEIGKIKNGVKHSSSGPSRTITIFNSEGGQTGIDLVPVLAFNEKNWPKHLKIPNMNRRLEIGEKKWFIVPKTVKDDQALWRIHFPYLERNIIKNHKTAKPLIRILKRIRDVEGWHPLTSYSMRTLVMLKIAESYFDMDFWSDLNMGNAFLTLLLELEQRAKDGILPYLFLHEFNLFKSINAMELKKLSGRIRRIYNKCLDDPNILKSYYRLNMSSESTTIVQNWYEPRCIIS